MPVDQETRNALLEVLRALHSPGINPKQPDDEAELKRIQPDSKTANQIQPLDLMVYTHDNIPRPPPELVEKMSVIFNGITQVAYWAYQGSTVYLVKNHDGLFDGFLVFGYENSDLTALLSYTNINEQLRRGGMNFCHVSRF